MPRYFDDEQCRALWHIGASDYYGLIKQYGPVKRPGNPMGAYRAQERMARRRRIPWLFTFKTWWSVWQQSGRWHERGRSGYCMARHGDAGPYCPDNVYICTAGQNHSDSHKNKPRQQNKPRT